MGKEADLSSLACSLRLNTDYSRVQFRSIISSASVWDACDRLDNMGAFDGKNREYHDTVLVIQYCCSSIIKFYAFYAVLSEIYFRGSRRNRLGLGSRCGMI